jgi:hypothetical protein
VRVSVSQRDNAKSEGSLLLLVNIETESNQVPDKALELPHQVHQLRIYLEYVDLVNTLNEEVRLHSLWNDRSISDVGGLRARL